MTDAREQVIDVLARLFGAGIDDAALVGVSVGGGGMGGAPC